MDFLIGLFLVENSIQSALKTLHILEEKQFITIIEDTVTGSPSLPGKPLGIKEFQQWIFDAEDSATISLKEAKQKWANKRKQLQKRGK